MGGIGIMIEDGIQPKSADAVRAWVEGGGKLKVGGDVLVGLKRWETLVPKTPEADKLLENMADELQAALGQKARLIGVSDLPAGFTAASGQGSFPLAPRPTRPPREASCPRR